MACRGRFKLSDFWLNHKDATLFATSQWPVNQFIFMAYRVFLALYLMTWLIIHMARTSPFGGFFIFLTNWTFTVLTTYAVSSCIGSLYFTLVVKKNRSLHKTNAEPLQVLGRHANRDHSPESATDHLPTPTLAPHPPSQDTPGPRLPHYFKFSWVLFNICLAVNPIVTLVFWVFLSGPGRDPFSQTINVHLHALNTFFIYLDLFLSATPVRFVHSIYPVFYGLLYIVFTLIYYLAGGVNPDSGDPAIYPGIIDWSNAGWTVFSAVMVAICVPLTHLVGYGCYRIRVLIHRRYLRPGEERRALTSAEETPSGYDGY